MQVRLLRREDRGEWLRLLVKLYPHTSENDHIPLVDAYLAGSTTGELVPSAVFVHERAGGGLGAFLELSLRNYAEGCDGETPYIESWFVDGDLRGRGIGRKLVDAAVAWAKQRGYSALASDAELLNDASHRAHEAVGFEEVERVVHFRKLL